LNGHRGAVRALAFDSSGRLVSGGEDSQVLFWEEGQLVESWPFQACISALGVEDHWLGIALLNGQVELRRAGELVWSLPAGSPVRSLALSSSWLALGLDDGRVRLVALSDLREQPGFRLDGHVTGLTFMRDGALAASSPLHQGIELWRLSEREACGHLQLGRRRCLAARPEGGLLAGGEHDVRAWPDGPVHLPGSPALAMSVAGEWLAVGCVNADLRLFHRPTGRLLLGEGHRGEILSTAIRDGLIASGSMDTTIRLWTRADFREPGPAEGAKAT
jgi:WD40 repeat protein